jgi:hypothetical protein
MTTKQNWPPGALKTGSDVTNRFIDPDFLLIGKSVTELHFFQQFWCNFSNSRAKGHLLTGNDVTTRKFDLDLV